MDRQHLNQKPRYRVIILMLILLTLALYAPLANHAFVNLDDDQYVTANPVVKSGVTWRGMVWAFTSGYAQNWHPLTWISHMLDCQWFGLNAAGHHLTNLWLHIANTLLLFLFLNRTTNAIWRSGFVAALFACHPLHVESVAWVAERKDVLSAFFGLLTLLAYARYAEAGKKFYVLALIFFLLGLMSKPMLVTLPFVMLLLDFWPLNRLQNRELKVQNLLLEKIPFFLAAAISSVITFLVQRAGGAVSSDAPVSLRLANASVAYVRYIYKTFWPDQLAVFYPFPAHWPAWLVAFATIFLLAISILVIRFCRRCPYCFTGWFWFLGMLVPVIGLVQAGQQSMADRYMYLPAIGLFLIAVWGIEELFRQHKSGAFALGTVSLAGCFVVSEIQLACWQNSVTLFSHARNVTQGNYFADSHLGAAFWERRQTNEAATFFNEALQLNPEYARGQSAFASVLMEQGKLPEAIDHFRIATALKPGDAELQYNLGLALLNSGNLNDSAICFSNALQRDSHFADAHCNLAVALFQRGDLAGALAQLALAVQLDPTSTQAHFNYGLALLNNHQPDAAAGEFRRQLALAPDSAAGHYYLAHILAGQSKSQPAVAEFWGALRRAPDFPQALNELAWILATDSDSKIRSGSVAVHLAEHACKLAPQDPAMLTTLGAAYAESGRFDDAIQTVEKARTSALAANEKEIVVTDDLLLKCCRDHRPYHRDL